MLRLHDTRMLSSHRQPPRAADHLPGAGTGTPAPHPGRAGADTGRPDAALGHRLAAFASLYRNVQARHLGLTTADAKALALIVEFGPVTTGQLASLAGISSGGTTAVIDRLEQAGLVSRGKHPLDRRVVIVRAAPGQHAEIGRCLSSAADTLAEVEQHFPPEQLAVVERFVGACLAALKQHAQSASLASDLDAERHPPRSGPAAKTSG